MSKVIKPIVLNPNESLEIKLPKYGKLITKKSGKDLLIFEEGSDTPLAVYENYEAVASTIDLSSLPHFAEATATTTAAAIASDATTTAVIAESTIPTWVYVAGGVGIVGGGIALASGGGGGSGSSTSVVTPPASDTTAPLFTSAATATTAENVATTTAVYTAIATDESLPLAYTISGVDAALFDLDGVTGAVTFKTSPDFEAPSDTGANNIYDFTITATDTAGNHSDQSVALSVTDVVESLAGQSVIDLGSYGKLIAPVQINGNWYYFWDLSGDGTSANTGALNGGVDYTTHDVLDGLFNHDINGVTNTTVANVDGLFGTTNDYRYGAINGVNLALLTTGTGLANEGSALYYLRDNQTSYTDLAAVWDAHNTGVDTSGTPAGWQTVDYWSATPSTDGHAGVSTGDGSVYDDEDSGGVYVALQVL